MTPDPSHFSSCTCSSPPTPTTPAPTATTPPNNFDAAVSPSRSAPPKNEPTTALCNPIRPPPARRRPCPPTTQNGLTLLPNIFCAALLCLLLLCPGTTYASTVYGASDIFPGELLFDRREAPAPRMPLEARQDGMSSTTTTIIKPSKSATATGSLQTAQQTSPTKLPRPFDTSIGNNFTSSACPNFFHEFLSNQTFQECLPFSLLLQTSTSFFQTSKSPLALTTTLQQTCTTNLPLCTAYLSQLATTLQSPSTCGPDLTLQNPIALQALLGLQAFSTLHTASCLTDPSTGAYCYTDAVTNASAPESSYIYYLPLGIQLPGGARPACTWCLQQTMRVFAQGGDDALQGNYAGAAQQVLMNCGPGFVETAVINSGGAADAVGTPTVLMMVVLAVAVLMNLF